MHVDDMASACIFLLERLDAKTLYEDLKVSHINIGVGEDIRIIDLARMIGRIVGFEGEIRIDPSKPDGTPRKLMDVSRLKSLGFSAKISLEEGIQEVYNFFLTSPR
jgi:nucleoside-diphosphate-sugar epimerase